MSLIPTRRSIKTAGLQFMQFDKVVMPLGLPNFKELRKKSGYTLRQVEDKTGISNPYLSQLETGKVKNPSYKVVATLINLYNIKDKQ